MRLSDSPEEAAFRAEVRAFIEKELPESLRVKDRAELLGGELAGSGQEERQGLEARPGGAGFESLTGDAAVWRKSLLKRGWVAPGWPTEYGGGGLTMMEQFILGEEFAEAGAPQVGGMGITMLGPTLIAFGTDEQKQQHLPKILSGESVWCQGFSEPGAGSDLASLQTRAVRDGDDFLIQGSKIWTSGAQTSNWMFILARTEPQAPKHHGISYFLLDFSSPGITVQPLVNMANIHGYNQIFFDKVRVPARNLVGELNRGWYVAMATLDFERSGIGTAVGLLQGIEGLIDWAKENAANGRSTLARNSALRYELVDRYIEANVARMLSNRVVHLQTTGKVPGHEASMVKLFQTELSQRVYRTALKAAGLYGISWERDSEHSPKRAQYARSYVQSVGATIAGGTSEIQRNIIAWRGLGMPRS